MISNKSWCLHDQGTLFLLGGISNSLARDACERILTVQQRVVSLPDLADRRGIELMFQAG